MRFEPYGSPEARSVADGGYYVFAEPVDGILIFPGVPFLGELGRVGNFGTIRATLTTDRHPRDWRQRATYYLERARDQLVGLEAIRHPQLERSLREEAEMGGFIVELNDGRVRRFNELRSRGAGDRGSPIFRLGAMDWADAELASGRATYADMFRGPISPPYARPRIYVPHIIPARGEHPPIVTGEVEQLPIHSLMVDQYGHVRMAGWQAGGAPSAIRNAYGLKANAMRLVDDRALSGTDMIDPIEIADAWDVTTDAFIEAGLPLQEAFARENAAYWRRRATVSSRRPARPSRKRRP